MAVPSAVPPVGGGGCVCIASCSGHDTMSFTIWNSPLEHAMHEERCCMELQSTQITPHTSCHQTPVHRHKHSNPARQCTRPELHRPSRLVGSLCLLRGCVALEYGLVLLGLHCFLRLAHALYSRGMPGLCCFLRVSQTQQGHGQTPIHEHNPVQCMQAGKMCVSTQSMPCERVHPYMAGVLG